MCLVFNTHYSALTSSTAASSGSAPHTWTHPSIEVKRRGSVGWKDSDWTTPFPTGSFKVREPYKDRLQLHIFNLTLCHSIGSVGHVTYSAHLHQIPEVNMAIFWTAQNMRVFIRQTAVKLIAFIGMTGVPVKRHHRNTLYWSDNSIDV